MSVLFSQLISPSPSPAIHKSLLHICVTFPPLQTGSSILFFFPYACIIIRLFEVVNNLVCFLIVAKPVLLPLWEMRNLKEKWSDLWSMEDVKSFKHIYLRTCFVVRALPFYVLKRPCVLFSFCDTLANLQISLSLFFFSTAFENAMWRRLGRCLYESG